MSEEAPLTDGSPLNVSQTELAKLDAANTRLGIDIGISSIKLVWLSGGSTPEDVFLTFSSFDADRAEECLTFVKGFIQGKLSSRQACSVPVTVVLTGKRSLEFQSTLGDTPGVELRIQDEFHCQATAVEFLITNIPKSTFTYSEEVFKNYLQPRDPVFPYLLVNIGSGVSFIRVSGKDEHEQIGGTSLGGGTLSGLLALLTKSFSFDEMLDLAAQGDNAQVDKLIGDIYGTDYNGIGMKRTAIASSFGKVFSMRRPTEPEENGDDAAAAPEAVPELGPDASVSDSFGLADVHVCRSLVFAIFNNIGQLANLHSELHDVTHVYFGGPFIRGHHQTISTLNIALNYYSKGKKRAHFLTHEDSLAAIGAFLQF